MQLTQQDGTKLHIFPQHIIAVGEGRRSDDEISGSVIWADKYIFYVKESVDQVMQWIPQ